jgi:hypothetical protein
LIFMDINFSWRPQFYDSIFQILILRRNIKTIQIPRKIKFHTFSRCFKQICRYTAVTLTKIRMCMCGCKGSGWRLGSSIETSQTVCTARYLIQIYHVWEGIFEKYQSSDEKFPEPNIIVLSGYTYYIFTSNVNKGLSW